MFSHFLRKLRSLAARPDPSAVRAGGFVWHSASAELAPHLPALFNHPTAVVVKRNLQRTILRVELPGGAVFVKRIRANTPRAWLRELLRPPKARLEFENARRLHELGFWTAEPLAWAESDSFGPGESVVVTREVPAAIPLDAFLTDTTLSLAARRWLPTTLGALFAALHAAGVSHPDPHPGNFLIQPATGRLALLDVHAVRFGPPLRWEEARANLVLLNRWFQLRASRTDRARFWRAYTAGRAGGVSPLVASDTRGLTPPARLESDTAASNRRFWLGRDARYFGNNRQFRRVNGDGVRGHAVRGLPDELVRSWLADPDVVFIQPGVTVLKDSPSSTVVVAGGLLWKRFRLKRPADALKNLFRRSEALRSWAVGHGLIDRHLPTARPLFVAHRHRLGIPREGYLAFEVVPDAVELPDFAASASFAELRRLADSLGRLVRTLHDRGVSHRDLKPANILLSGPDRRPVVIDLVGAAVHANVPDGFRRRDLTRLNAGFVRSPQVSHTLRLRLLRTYLLAWPHRPDDWKAWWRAVAAATGRKVLKNLHRGRPLA